jgi:ubiquinone/menaquinone biosynthesis C-methylase UbiE
MASVRERVHGMWSSVASGWRVHADEIDARGAALAERMLDVAAPGPGDRVLELACGPGGLGIAAARRVGSSGEVTLSDVSEAMVDTAAARAAGAGLGNVRARRIDFEAIDEPDAAFDVVLCREGLMFAVEPDRACAEIARVLRPGGRVAVAVWDARERNPWLAALLDAVGAQLGETLPPPGVPGPFSLAGGTRLAGLLADAGFDGVAVEEVAVPLRAPSPEAWWARGVALGGPVARRLESLPPEGIAAARADALAAVAAYAEPDGGLTVPGVTLLAHASRSSAPISSTP